MVTYIPPEVLTGPEPKPKGVETDRPEVEELEKNIFPSVKQMEEEKFLAESSDPSTEFDIDYTQEEVDVEDRRREFELSKSTDPTGEGIIPNLTYSVGGGRRKAASGIFYKTGETNVRTRIAIGDKLEEGKGEGEYPGQFYKVEIGRPSGNVYNYKLPEKPTREQISYLIDRSEEKDDALTPWGKLKATQKRIQDTIWSALKPFEEGPVESQVAKLGADVYVSGKITEKVQRILNKWEQTSQRIPGVNKLSKAERVIKSILRAVGMGANALLVEKTGQAVGVFRPSESAAWFAGVSPAAFKLLGGGYRGIKWAAKPILFKKARADYTGRKIVRFFNEYNKNIIKWTQQQGFIQRIMRRNKKSMNSQDLYDHFDKTYGDIEVPVSAFQESSKFINAVKKDWKKLEGMGPVPDILIKQLDTFQGLVQRGESLSFKEARVMLQGIGAIMAHARRMAYRGELPSEALGKIKAGSLGQYHKAVQHDLNYAYQNVNPDDVIRKRTLKAMETGAAGIKGKHSIERSGVAGLLARTKYKLQLSSGARTLKAANQMYKAEQAASTYHDMLLKAYKGTEDFADAAKVFNLKGFIEDFNDLTNPASKVYKSSGGKLFVEGLGGEKRVKQMKKFLEWTAEQAPKEGFGPGSLVIRQRLAKGGEAVITGIIGGSIATSSLGGLLTAGAATAAARIPEVIADFTKKPGLGARFLKNVMINAKMPREKLVRYASALAALARKGDPYTYEKGMMIINLIQPEKQQEQPQPGSGRMIQEREQKTKDVRGALGLGSIPLKQRASEARKRFQQR